MIIYFSFKVQFSRLILVQIYSIEKIELVIML